MKILKLSASEVYEQYLNRDFPVGLVPRSTYFQTTKFLIQPDFDKMAQSTPTSLDKLPREIREAIISETMNAEDYQAAKKSVKAITNMA